MRRFAISCVGCLVCFSGALTAQELNFRAVVRAKGDPIPISLGMPQPASPGASIVDPLAPRVVRGQMPSDGIPAITVPPPPPFPGTAGGVGGVPRPPVFPGGGAALGRGKAKPNEEDYNCGRINNDADQGGFFTRCGDKLSRCWMDVTDGIGGTFAGGAGRTLLQSDQRFSSFISPVSNPHFFEDPRALTEIRPIFMWQGTRDGAQVFKGGDNFFATLQARVALTDNISIVMNRLGWTWIDPGQPGAGLASSSGFSELHVGPKFSFGDEAAGRVMAIGANFELPIGRSTVGQDTGTLGISPYFSIAQKLGGISYGSFNFMNTTGASIGIDGQRTNSVYSSLHLDFDVGDAKKFYPLIELNWMRYFNNGGARQLGLEGSNNFNFGSRGVAGHDDLTLALGARYKFTDHISIGGAGEFSVLGGTRHLDAFRLTIDMIFRY